MSMRHPMEEYFAAGGGGGPMAHPGMYAVPSPMDQQQQPGPYGHPGAHPAEYMAAAQAMYGSGTYTGGSFGEDRVSSTLSNPNASVFVPQSQMQDPAAPIIRHDPNRRFDGVVKAFSVGSGFGFIKCDEINTMYDRDVFFNRAIEGAAKVVPGLKVTFNVELNEKGQPQARDIKPSGLLKPDRAAPPKDQIFIGVIRTYNANIGYGFINCQELRELYDHDVFLHKSQYERIPDLQIGEKVCFRVQMNMRGQPQAIDVESAKGKLEVAEAEEIIPPPGGEGKRWLGKIRGFHKEGYAFLECDEAVTVFGHQDIFAHKANCPELNGKAEYYEFDVVMVKGRPQARSLTVIDPEEAKKK